MAIVPEVIILENLLYNIDELSKETIRETVEKGHIHRASFSGTQYLLHYDQERDEVDVYELVAVHSFISDFLEVAE